MSFVLCCDILHREHHCPIHPLQKPTECTTSHYDSTYDGHQGHRRRPPIYPIIERRDVPEYSAEALETVQQADYIDHKQPRPHVVHKYEAYQPPRDIDRHGSTYESSYQPNKGGAAKLARPPTEMPRGKHQVNMLTTHKDNFREWDLPRRFHFADPRAPPLFQGQFNPLSTHQLDFNEQVYKGRPATSCKVKEAPYATGEPFRDRTTSQDTYRFRGLDGQPRAHKNVKQPYQPSSDMPMSSFTQYSFSHPKERPYQRRRGICVPLKDSIELSGDRTMLLNSEQQAMYQMPHGRAATPCKPRHDYIATEVPFDGTTTQRLDYLNHGHVRAAQLERPPTQMQDRGEMDLLTTTKVHFCDKGTKPRQRHGDMREVPLPVDPSKEFPGLSTNAKDYVCHGSNAERVRPVKPLDERFGRNNCSDGLEGVASYTLHYPKKPIIPVCPASLLPGGKMRAHERQMFKNRSFLTKA